MIQDVKQLKVTMEQMDRLLRALDNLRETVLPKNPQLFATMAEGPLDDLERLRQDMREFADELQPTA